MQRTTFRFVLLLVFLFMPAIWCGAISTCSNDGYSNLLIKAGQIQGTPKGSTIQASIDGHTLTVVFTENIGLVQVEITTAEGSNVYYTMRNTPNGIVYNIPGTGDFVVTFTLENGDEYYGEFTITD